VADIRKIIKNINWRAVSLEIGGFILVFIMFLLATGFFAD